MAPPPGQAATAAFLSALAGGTAPLETHISLVFLGPDTVWKLKKAVRLSFLDFTGLATRHRLIARELEINAPAAPGLYRDIAPVVRRADGTLTLGGEGEVIDWVLRMARVPAEDFLRPIAARGALTPALLDAIADAVAAYHARLPPAGIDPVAAMERVITGNRTAAHDAGLDPATVARWTEGALALLAARADWLAGRGRAGFVRRAHGDLHLGNLCLWQGRPVLFDALEFDEALATIDLGYDLAFLLMDLDFAIGRPAANRAMNRYIARTGDVGLLHGMALFLSVRAMVRAHVETARGDAATGAAYLRYAMACLAPAPPLAVAVGGLPGTGKSTLARALAPALGAAPGAVILRSDEIRKRQHGRAPEERLPPEAYTPAASAAVFERLAGDMAEALAAGQSAIADATFLDPAHRALAEAAAARAGLRLRGLWLTAPMPVLEARVAARASAAEADASDATLAVLRAARDPGAGDWTAVDATDGAAAERHARVALALTA